MIDPGGVPTIPGDMDALSGHATTLRGVGSDFAGTGQRINSTWQGLSGVYHAPEVGQLLSATSPVETISASVGADMGTVAGALSSYATEVKQIQTALASLKSQAGEFVASTEGDDDWKSDDGKVDRNNQLVSAVNAQMAAYFEAQRRCANTINALYGGPQYRADDGDGKQSEGEYGYTADQLNAAAGEDGALPWGKTEEKDRGLLGDVGAFFVGVKDGAVGFATGLGALIGRDPTTGDWSWGTAGTAWKGLGTFALAAGVYAVPGGAQLDQTFGVPGFERGQMGNTLLTAGKSLIAYDEWGKDKSRAAGMATFNVVSAVLGTKGAGAGLRGAGAAAEGSRIAAVSKTGTVMLHTGEAIGKLPTVTDLAKGIGKHFPNLHLPNFSGTTHINVPHHVDTPPIHTPDTPSVHTPHTPTVHTPDTPTAHTPTVHTPDTPTVHTPHNDTPVAPRPGSVGDALSHTPTHADPPASTPSAAAPSHHTDVPTPHHTDAPAPHSPAQHTDVPSQPGAHPPPAHGGGHTDIPPHHNETPGQPAAHTPPTHAGGHTDAPAHQPDAPSHRDTPHSASATGAPHAPAAHESAPGNHSTTHDHAPGEHAPQDHTPPSHDSSPASLTHGHTPGDHGQFDHTTLIHNDVQNVPATIHEPPTSHHEGSDYSGNSEYRSSEQVRQDFQAYYQHFNDDHAAVTRIVADNAEYRGIPTEDLVAIRAYTSEFHSPLNGETLYRDINNALRNGDLAKLEYYDAHIRTATSGLNQLPRFEGQVFRGVAVHSPDVAADIASNYKPGAIVTERPFTSSSASENLNFNGLVQFTIDSSRGRDITALSHFGTSEREVLFPPGTDFRVVSRSFDPESGAWHIVMREE